VQEEVAKLRSEDPAFKLARTLSEMYGRPVEQVLAQIEQARIEREAEDRKIPVDQVQREYNEKANFEQEKAAIQSVKEENNQLQYQVWQNRMTTEELELRKAPELAALTDDDIKAAQVYMLQTMQNPNASLEEAVYAVHGRKIAENLRNIARNDALAEISGRKNGGLPPQGGKPSPTASLTDEERYIAKMMGVSEEDYLANK
jgi:phage I-like protein